MHARTNVRRHVSRLGLALARPAGLAGAAATGAVAGFGATRIPVARLAQALGAVLHTGVGLYVRYRTERRASPKEDRP